MPYLLVCRESKGYRLVRFAESFRIGRAEDNDVILNDVKDLSVSRHHAYIERVGNTYTLYDRSKNGTFVDEVKVDTYPLAHGTTFQIVEYLFTFVDEAAAEQLGPKVVMSGQRLPQDESGEETLVPAGEVQALGQGERQALKRRLFEEGIVVESEKMFRFYRDVQTVAGINVPVLILGEPGVGKEHIAHTLHHYSKATGNFIALNCSSIPEGLFESELFGSVKGAYNHAIEKPGKLELADKGTIFLDEIGDMGLSLQPKLLRFIEDHEVTRLGGTKTKKVNARVVAATNQDLKAMMAQNTFREDFYQRLACIKLEVPPLRERQEDIEPLSHFFLHRFSKEQGWKVPTLSSSAAKMLVQYHWPGNVRELRNVLIGAMIQVEGKTIYPRHLLAVSEDLGKLSKRPAQNFLSMEEMEKQHIEQALAQAGGNKTEAARLLGISRDTLYNKITRFKIKGEPS